MERLADHLAGRNLAIVDVETTGTHPGYSRIIEIGILRIENGKCVETFTTCINPEQEVLPWISRLTGITQEEVDRAPLFVEVIDEVRRLLHDAVFVAHSVGFDYAFIQHEFMRAGRSFHAECLCTVRLSRLLSPRARRHNLSRIIERHGFVCRARHRAYDDAHVLWQLLQWGHEKYGAKIVSMIERTIQPATRPRFVEIEEGMPVIQYV